jgi:transposase
MFGVNGRSERYFSVKALARLGLSDYDIAERTGVSRSTVQRWRHRELPPARALR